MDSFSDFNHIICGDCRTELGKFKPESVQSIITSPPYWGLRDYGHNNQIGLENTIENYLNQITIVFSLLKKILRKDGVLWLNIGDGYTSGNRRYRAGDNRNKYRGLNYRPATPNGLKEKELLGIPWKIAFMLQNMGWYLRSDIIWHKPNAMPESVKDRPYRNHEYLFLLAKSPKYYFNSSSLIKDNKKLRSVWTISNNSRSTVHSATFPKELVEYCIKTSSKAGDTILDPFCGVGTVGEVCNKLNRRFVGIEINRSYANEALKK